MKTNQLQASALVRTNFFSRREMSELPLLLMPGEQVLAVISGFYTAGTAILCVTSKRILLVDKKMIRLAIEDVRFEAIKEVGYSHQAVMASVRFLYSGNELHFRSWHRNELRMLSQMVQQKMFEIREGMQMNYQQAEPPTNQQPAPFVYNPAREADKPAYGLSDNLEQYLNNRIARWRRASRFSDIALSTRAGREVLRLLEVR